MTIFTPKKIQTTNDFETIRLNTVRANNSNDAEVTSMVKNAQSWLPPASVLQRVAELINLFIDYIKGIGRHDTFLPDFLSSQCLEEVAGDIIYNFGPDAKEDINRLLKKCGIQTTKRKSSDTPQKR